jgi:opacity protein-like surface antigen
MIKKTVLSSIVLLSISSPLFAETTSYVGGGVGFGGYYYDYNNYHTSGVSGGSLNLFAGRGKYLGSEKLLYIGGELGANYTRASSGRNAFGLNASLIPGLMITDKTMLYGRLGLATSYIPKNSVSFATVLGAGVQTNIAKNWDVRAEYINFAAGRSGEVGVGLVYKFD